MWYLISTNDTRVLYVLPHNTVTIGRAIDTAVCDFPVPDDASISRKHATLSIEDKQLYIKDLGSKYGTFLNESTDKLEHNVNIKLNCDDVIKFGKMNSVWKVNNINFITCTSTLKGEDVQSLKIVLKNLGGDLKNDWDDTCQFLTMPAITLTIKVVLALVQNSHIVKISYWAKCMEALNNKTELPNPNDFVPEITESTLNKEQVSFMPLKERSTLFTSRKVIFFSRRQFEMYKVALLKSSGTPLLLSETKMTKSMLCETNVIVIQYNSTSVGPETQSQREQINEIIEYLKNKGKRVIADAEIGLAILYCSIDKYCNPYFNFPIEVMKQAPCTSSKESNVLAQESQENSQNIKKENIIIDESLTAENKSLKRKSCDDFDNISNESKKKARDNTIERIDEEDKQSVSYKTVAIDNNMEELDFNFLEPAPVSIAHNTDSSSKKLNLFKPLKRKIGENDTEDTDLFNFVEDENAEKSLINNLEHAKRLKIDDKHTKEMNDISTDTDNQKVNLDALRGMKLNELMVINANMKTFKHIKKEDVSEIEEKFKNIDFGSTTIIVKNDLIVKREPLSITVNDKGTKNFKKFKKVWPVKLQITLVSNACHNKNSVNEAYQEEDLFAD